MEPQEDDNVIQLSVPGGTPRKPETHDNPPQPGAVLAIPAPQRMGDAAPIALPAFSIPQWVWVAGGAIVFLGLVYYLQKGHVSKTRQAPRRSNPSKPRKARKPKPARVDEDDDDDPD